MPEILGEPDGVLRLPPIAPTPRGIDLSWRQRQEIEHEPDDSCAGEGGSSAHCWAHNVDEYVGTGPVYQACIECGHLYRSKRELRRAYLRVHWQFFTAAWRDRHMRESYPTELRDPPLAELAHWVWRALTVRASKIYFCQHCIHDF